MKKIFLFLTAFCILQNANAQFSIGASLGISSSKAKYDLTSGFSEIKKSSLVGVPISLLAEINLSRNIRLSTGFSLLKKGLVLKSTYTGGDYDKFTYNLSYIEVPASLKIYFINKNSLRLFGIVGPQISFMAKGILKSEEKDGSVTNSTSKRIVPKDDGFETIDLGIRIGAGVEYVAPFGSLFLSPIFHKGFTNLDSKKVFDFKNNLLSFNVGYLYTFKKSGKK
jgi:hypothetical protein